MEYIIKKLSTHYQDEFREIKTPVITTTISVVLEYEFYG